MSYLHFNSNKKLTSWKKDTAYLQSFSKRNLYLSETFKNCCFPKPDFKFEETLCTFDQNLFSLLSLNSQKLLGVILSFKILWFYEKLWFLNFDFCTPLGAVSTVLFLTYY